MARQAGRASERDDGPTLATKGVGAARAKQALAAEDKREGGLEGGRRREAGLARERPQKLKQLAATKGSFPRVCIMQVDNHRALERQRNSAWVPESRGGRELASDVDCMER